jgi:hypothetical protein
MPRGRSGNLSQIIATAEMSYQIPRTRIEAAVTDVYYAMSVWDLCSRRNERLETDQQQIFAVIVSDFFFFFLGGNNVTGMRLPPVAEKHVEIEFNGLLPSWVDTDACGIAFDGHRAPPRTRGPG